MIHELKILPKYYNDVQANIKNFEIRKADRDFNVDDYLDLKEWDNEKFTGRHIIRQIEYIYKGDGSYGLNEGYCILGLKTSQITMIQTGNNNYQIGHINTYFES